MVELEVSPRQYDAQQIEGIFDTVYEQILQEMVSGNEPNRGLLYFRWKVLDIKG